jgi:hypothetical protein
MAIVTLRLMPTQERQEEEQESNMIRSRALMLGEPWAQCTSTACECSFAFSASGNVEVMSKSQKPVLLHSAYQ